MFYWYFEQVFGLARTLSSVLLIAKLLLLLVRTCR
jgi:hypothetical protein